MLRSRRMTRWLLAGAVLALALHAQAAEVDKYLPNDTEFVATLNVKQLLDSPLIKKHALEQMKGLLKANDEAVKIMEAMGFDPFRDLTSVTGAGTGFSNDAKGVVIAHGNFDPAKVEAKAEEIAKQKSDTLKVGTEGGHKIFEIKNPSDEKPMFVAVVDKNTLVASQEKGYVTEAFARASGKSGSVKAELKGLIEKTDPNQSMWMVVPGSVLSKSELASEERAKKSLEKVDNLALGMTISKDVKLGLAITAKTADNAKELAEEVKEGLNQAKGFLALLAGNMKELAPVVDLVGSIKVNTEGNTVSLKSEVSEELIEKGLKKDQ